MNDQIFGDSAYQMERDHQGHTAFWNRNGSEFEVSKGIKT